MVSIVQDFGVDVDLEEVQDSAHEAPDVACLLPLRHRLRRCVCVRVCACMCVRAFGVRVCLPAPVRLRARAGPVSLSVPDLDNKCCGVCCVDGSGQVT